MRLSDTEMYLLNVMYGEWREWYKDSLKGYENEEERKEGEEMMRDTIKVMDKVMDFLKKENK